ncbi:aromatic prenyltransferase, partial [Mycena capillaripes]
LPTMSSWWNTIALPIISFMRRQNYPENSLDAYIVLFRDEILPLLGPFKTSAVYPSWLTDDHTPVEFSLLLGSRTKSSVRFAFEPLALSLAGDHSIATLRRTLEQLARAFTLEPKFDLEWFDICANELLLSEAQTRAVTDLPASETWIGFDCAHYSACAKVYFMPRVRSFALKETVEDMMLRTTTRLGLDKPWAKISQFLSRFLPGDRPEIDIVAIDCIPGAKNRFKIYFRVDLVSYAQIEYFLTLGGMVSTADIYAGLRNTRLMWDAMTNVNGTPTKSFYFPAALIYYELKLADDMPSSKVYLPVRRYHSNDLETSRGVEHLVSQLSDTSTANEGYADFMQTTFSHRMLSTRTGIHTYVGCTVKPSGSSISVYYNAEAFAAE